MAIILNDPIVRVDGVRTDYFGTTSDFFKRIKSHLRDENIYDTSEAAVPFSNRIVSFEGTAERGQTLRAYNSTQGAKRLVNQFTADSTGVFEISVLLRNGKNAMSVESLDGSETSNIVYLNAYKLDAWLSVYADEMETIRDVASQTRQDSKLRDGEDFEGDPISNTGQGLTDSFGQFIRPLVRQSGFTVNQWRESIRGVFESYQIAPSVRAMNLICRLFTGIDADFKYYVDDSRLRRPEFRDNYSFLASAANPGVDTTVTWKQTQFHLYQRWWTGRVEVTGLALNDTTYIYYDGTTLSTGLGSTAIVNFLAEPQFSTSPPIATGTTPITETVASAFVQIDTGGQATSLTGELFAELSFPVIALNGVSGSVSPFTAGIDEANRVSGTQYIDLGHAQIGQEKRRLFGDLTIDYETPYQIYEVAQVETNGTTVTDMITGHRYDEVSGIIRETQMAQHAGEMLIYNSQTLTSGTRNILTGVLIDARPPGKLFYVFMEDPTTGQMTYYSPV